MLQQHGAPRHFLLDHLPSGGYGFAAEPMDLQPESFVKTLPRPQLQVALHLSAGYYLWLQ
jgi:hypothetical protein